MTEQEIRHNISQRLGIEKLNHMQAVMADTTAPLTILLAPTGSGKTLAFAIPLLQSLDAPAGTVQAVVIAPSRELVLQIYDVIRPIATGYKTVAFYGGHSMQDEVNSLVMTPDIIISTPGRLVDHIMRGRLRPGSHLRTLVLDEYDKSLELGFTDEMRRILRFFVAPGRIILTSATRLDELPDYLPRAAKAQVVDFVSDASTVRPHISVARVESPVPDKLDTLSALLRSLSDGKKTIVFVNYRDAAERVYRRLRAERMPVGLYHGGLEQQDRDKAVEMLNNGSTPILVSTDLASRGLDIDTVDAVVHYHPATSEATWTHRNGRTGRQGTSGEVYFIVADSTEDIPEFVSYDRDYTPDPEAPALSAATTASLYLNLGKKEKISRGDIVGFLLAHTSLEAAQIGRIALRDHSAIVAVPASMLQQVLEGVAHQKIKNQKVKVTQLRACHI